jgi:addiction module RelE/StbE family toxin
MKITWSPTAISDLAWIRNYIAYDSPKAARKITAIIKNSVQRLREFPLSGRIGREPETRELVIPGTNYVAVYVIRENELWIAAILHGRQDWPENEAHETGDLE